jgi:hypothetical protein
MIHEHISGGVIKKCETVETMSKTRHLVDRSIGPLKIKRERQLGIVMQETDVGSDIDVRAKITLKAVSKSGIDHAGSVDHGEGRRCTGGSMEAAQRY